MMGSDGLSINPIKSSLILLIRQEHSSRLGTFCIESIFRQQALKKDSKSSADGRMKSCLTQQPEPQAGMSMKMT
jgi:hypothetical protein